MVSNTEKDVPHFLMVSIKYGGSIRRLGCQAAPRLVAVLRHLLFSAALSLSFHPGSVASLHAASSSGDPGSPSARVVTVQYPGVMKAFNPRPEKIKTMLRRGMTLLTGENEPAEAWTSLVSTQEVIGIKVHSAPGAIIGTNPEVVAALVEDLLAAGFQPDQLIIWDKQMADLERAGFDKLAERYQVRLRSSAAAGYDPDTFYETSLIGQLVFGDLEFGKKGENVGRKSYLSKLITREVTKIINVTPLLNHNHAGVSGNLWGLAMGSVDNTLRFQVNAERLARAVPELVALPELGDQVVLNIVDALVCQYEGGQKAMLHYSRILNQLRFSTDPVALDVLSLQELNRRRHDAGVQSKPPNWALYENASLLQIGVSEPGRIQVETEVMEPETP
jgi:hypothetical protein